MNKKETIGDKFIKLYPDRIPVIVNYENIQKNFLVKSDSTIACITVLIRRNEKINYTETLNLTVDNIQVDNKEIISTVYSKYKNPYDGCLHIKATRETTFGK